MFGHHKDLLRAARREMMVNRTAEYNRDMKAWVARRDAGEDPGKKPTLRMEFNRIEQGLLMTNAARLEEQAAQQSVVIRRVHVQTGRVGTCGNTEQPKMFRFRPGTRRQKVFRIPGRNYLFFSQNVPTNVPISMFRSVTGNN